MLIGTIISDVCSFSFRFPTVKVKPTRKRDRRVFGLPSPSLSLSLSPLFHRTPGIGSSSNLTPRHLTFHEQTKLCPDVMRHFSLSLRHVLSRRVPWQLRSICLSNSASTWMHKSWDCDSVDAGWGKRVFTRAGLPTPISGPLPTRPSIFATNSDKFRLRVDTTFSRQLNFRIFTDIACDTGGNFGN